MYRTNLKVTVGGWSIDTLGDPITEFIAFETKLAMKALGDICSIAIHAMPASQPRLVERAIGEVSEGQELKETAFSIQIRGNAIKQGDQIIVELTAGELSGNVISAEVRAIQSSFGHTEIEGVTGMHKLAGTRINQVYENQTLAQIINDLADQAGVDTGEIETGSTYSYFVIHESKNLLRYILDLAMREGMDFYFETDNKLTLKKFNKTRADHIFRFGIDILDLQVFGHQPTTDHILIYGESPSSNQGSDTWHWIAKDISPFQSEVGQGSKTLAIQDGAVRTKDAADNFAVSKLGAIKDQSTWGRLKILGNPMVKLADAIEIKDCEKPELNGLFKVTEVRHILNKQEGYLTYIGFTGIGGPESATSLLGGSTGGL